MKGMNHSSRNAPDFLLQNISADIFFDIEGDPHASGGVHEYLLGYSSYDDAGSLEYEHIWGLTRESEKQAFEKFIDFVMER